MDVDDPSQVAGRRSVSRRQFIGRSAAAAGGLAVLTGAGGALLQPGAALAAAASPTALTVAELATLTAVLAQLLPADSLGPGAVEAGVPTYIDTSLAGSYKHLLPSYQDLLPMFDTAAQSLGAASFAELSESQQVQLLGEFEAGTAPGVAASDATAAAGLFQLLLEHMREGMFGDPMYGGNQGFAGWTLIGYPAIQIETLPKAQAIGANVPSSHKTAKSYGGKPYNGVPL